MADLARRTEDLIDFVAAARTHYGLGDLVGVGYSNGANILTSLLLSRPDLIRSAVLMHPLIPFALPAEQALAGMPVLITGGERDPIAPLAATRALADGLAARGAAVRALLHPGGHELPPEEVAAVRDFLALPAAAASAA
jgi:phospholipase/carboxylesterase